jgi:hypothetical protein
MKRVFWVLLGLVGMALMAYGTMLTVFDFIFPPPPPPRGWSPPKGNIGKVLDKLKEILDEKVNEFVER